MRAKHDQRRPGFSLLEAIIILVVASLILSVILPLASRAIRDNLRIGVIGLNAVDDGLSQDLLRRMGAAIVAPLGELGVAPPRHNAQGNAQRVRFTVLAQQDLPCAQAFRLQTVELRIEAAGTSGKLFCVPIVGREELAIRTETSGIEIYRWRGAFAAFEYSEDGRTWGAVWPPPELRVTLEDDLRRVFQSDGAVGLEAVSAPRLRFSIDRTLGRDSAWVIPLGEVGPIAIDPLAGFATPQRPTPGQPGFIP